jgi:diguanylate cyclase (GGDEF)-like protein
MNAAYLVSLQLLLYAALWALAGWLLPRERRAAWHWMAYALLGAGGLALVGLRGPAPTVWTHPIASLVLVASLLLARRGTEVFLHAPTTDRHSLLLLGGLALCLAGLGIQAETDHHRVALSALASAWVMCSAVPALARSLAPEFGTRAIWMVSPPLVVLALVHLATSLGAWRQGTASVTIEQASAQVQAATWGSTLVAAAAFNVMFLALLVARLVRRLHHEATHDPLTGLLNRRAMGQALALEWQRHRRMGTPFAAVSLDIDHFKRINDTHGHDVGDAVLVTVAQRLRDTVRDMDQVARMGGEEFLVLMPGCEAAGAGLATADRLRLAVAQGPLPVPVTLSAGVAGPLASDARVDTLLQRCDRALYAAKAQGRDRAVLLPGTAVDSAAETSAPAPAGPATLASPPAPASDSLTA